jgi:hypothetical protein
VRRGDAASCSFAAPGTRKKNQAQANTSPDDMQNRIDRLEGLVLSLMTNGPNSAGPAAAAAAVSRSQSDSVGSLQLDTGEDDDMIKEEGEEEGDECDSDVDGVANSLGVLKVDPDKGKSHYFGDSHWHLVLKDIAEVKNYFIVHKKELENNYERIKQTKPHTAIDGPAFLFNTSAHLSDDELRAALPPKPAVDKLVTRYFNSHDPAVHILHGPSFHQELHNHWRDPSKTSIIWLGLLNSILSLAMQSYNKIGDEPLEWKGQTLELAAEYRLRTCQCLVNSDYTKSDLYTLETLILYVHGEYASRWDAEVGIWVIVGMVVRLAIRMGYHRDPSNYKSLTPYQGEMRRRVWMFIRQMDTLFSFQLALPSMIRNSDTDTQLPRNIFEDEFGPDSKVLPPARPSTEPTPVSYMITKGHIAAEFGAILEEINTINGKPPAYEDILNRDNRLRDLRNNMAPHLRMRPIEECTHDPASLLMQRFGLELMWQKTVCVLHRKYLARARANPRYAHSRRACVDSSMEILRCQAQLHRESLPGGRMRTMKWYISSLTNHDYLLGAMVVLLDLNYDAMAEAMDDRPANYDPYFWSPDQRAEMIRALELSQSIWNESKDTSMEAYKASNIIGIVLEKVKNNASSSTNPASSASASVPPEQTPASTADVFAQFDEEKPEHSAAMGLGMLSGGLSPISGAAFNSMMAQSPRGTNYGATSAAGGFDVGMGGSDIAATSAGLSSGMPLDPINPFGSLNGMASPFSAFGGVNGQSLPLDMSSNLDWVSFVPSKPFISPFPYQIAVRYICIYIYIYKHN